MANNEVKLTVRKESAGVFLRVSDGEFLVARVTAFGAQPIFTLVDSGLQKLLLSQEDQPVSTSPSTTWQREWPGRSDSVPIDTSITLGMHFLAAIKYTYVLERRKAGGQVEKLIDIDYESTGAASRFFQDIGVSTR